MLGYAVTVTVDTTTPDVPRPQEGFSAWVKAMEAAPKPIVLVFKDVGPQPRKSAHMGEMMATLAGRFNAVGLVTDGGVRDLAEVHALGFHYFALGVAASHGNARLLEVNIPVTIDGVEIKPGDLVHGDLNGVTLIPNQIADQVAAEAKRLRDAELAMLEYLNGPDFAADGYLERRFSH
jgi:regulator of RNase E activity RraA